jgi:hypothetical protein
MVHRDVLSDEAFDRLKEAIREAEDKEQIQKLEVAATEDD